MTFYSLFEIVGTTRIRLAIRTLENVDVVHGERTPPSLKHFDGGLISPSRPTIADFVRRSSLRRAKAVFFD